jgi:hypothetical protein
MIAGHRLPDGPAGVTAGLAGMTEDTPLDAAREKETLGGLSLSRIL